MKKNNKITLLIMLMAAAGSLLQSCGKDNKVAYPESVISGSITYQGQPVGLMTTSADNISTANTFNTIIINQQGADYNGNNIKVFGKNDGTFTINTFDGDYMIRTAPGTKNPWPDPPAQYFTLKGSQNINFAVTPYYWVSDYKTTFINDVFTATFKLEKPVQPIIPPATTAPVTPNFDGVRVYFSTTQFADVGSAQNVFSRGGNSGFTVAAPGAGNTVVIGGNCTIRIDLSTMTQAEKNLIAASTGHIYANVAVKAAGITDALYQKPVFLK